MRLAFMGTPDFSVPTLDALAASRHDVVCVYTQPPRPAGRGKTLRRSPVHERAEALGIPVRTPERLKGAEEQEAFRGLDLDAAVVVAYGLILPQPVLDAPRLGCINVHASLLPRWRGAAPIQHAILAGDAETGVTIMQMEAGLDTGPMLAERRTPIAAGDTAGTLHDRLSVLGAGCIVETLERLAEGLITPRPQPDDGASYARKIARGDERLDWTRSAAALGRQVRAFAPVPGAYFEHAGEAIKVLAATPVAEGGGDPGTVLDDRLTVACGEGALRLERLKRPGKNAMAVADLLRGWPIAPGTRFG